MKFNSFLYPIPGTPIANQHIGFSPHVIRRDFFKDMNCLVFCVPTRDAQRAVFLSVVKTFVIKVSTFYKAVGNILHTLTFSKFFGKFELVTSQGHHFLTQVKYLFIQVYTTCQFYKFSDLFYCFNRHGVTPLVYALRYWGSGKAVEYTPFLNALQTPPAAFFAKGGPHG